MFGEDFDQGIVSLAIVGFGTKINCKLARRRFDNLFLRRTRLDRNNITIHVFIIALSA